MFLRHFREGPFSRKRGRAFSRPLGGRNDTHDVIPAHAGIQSAGSLAVMGFWPRLRAGVPSSCPCFFEDVLLQNWWVESLLAS
ncbi:MAG: hypothetical protein M2R45_04288 [Verrucomicrobia subdivision 3 bacterium]|nr:hypothetical protein [Limisphaerales bacterium]MCS1417395.1 hypothetical protein [Limisphaerales bacterium]